MADVKVENLPNAGTLTGDEFVMLVQDEVSVKIPLSSLAAWIKTAESIIPAGEPYRGCLVRRTSNYTIPSGNSFQVPFSTTEYDTDDFWSIANPSRLTIPAGVTKVRVTAQARFSSASGGIRQMWVYKNGVSDYPGAAMNLANGVTLASTYALNAVTAVLDVEEGDYFEMGVYHSQGSDLTLADIVNHTYLSLEVIEATP